jgi:hypothetical protein
MQQKKSDSSARYPAVHPNRRFKGLNYYESARVSPWAALINNIYNLHLVVG